jgi:hypothetical protein
VGAQSIGGHDASFIEAHDGAWIHRTTLVDLLGS